MNKALFRGTVESEVEFSHEFNKEKFYEFKLSMRRDSGTKDEVNCVMPEIIMKICGICKGIRAELSGQIRTMTVKCDDGHMSLVVYAFITQAYCGEELSDLSDVNEVVIDEGFVCKLPTLRETPAGRTISDLLVACHRTNGKSDYFPCIAWGRKAIEASFMEVGAVIKASGRFQSRIYNKKIDEDNYVEKTAYEISLSHIELIERSESDDN